MGKVMRTLASVVVLTIASQTAAAPPARPAAALAGLTPLSEKDMGRTREMGCQSSFTHGRDTLIFMIGHDFMVRTNAGLAICRISDRQFGSFGDGPAAITCGGRRLAVRRTGKIIAHEEADSAEGPALLTVTQGRVKTAIKGDWGTAC